MMVTSHVVSSYFGTSYQAGILLPETTLQTHWFAILATFVAINTLMYMALAIAKVLPKIYLSDFYTSRDKRRETRSIWPNDQPGSGSERPTHDDDER